MTDYLCLQSLQGGALPTDIIYLYLQCDGMDHSFVHNPAGTFAITLQQLLDPNGLHVFLEWFAQMIYSGHNVSLDNQTQLTIYAYSSLQGGAKSQIHNVKESFVTSSPSIVWITNDGAKLSESLMIKAYILKLEKNTSTKYMLVSICSTFLITLSIANLFHLFLLSWIPPSTHTKKSSIIVNVNMKMG